MAWRRVVADSPWADVCLAIALNLAEPWLAHLIPQTVRPDPGQLLPLVVNGSSLFIRAAAHDHPIVEESVPLGLLLAFMAACLALTLAASAAAPPASSAARGPLTAAAAWLWAIALTSLLTDAAKRYVGRLRPNWYAGCGWSDSTHACSIDFADGRHSFPSGHSSLSMAAGLSLTLYLRMIIDGRTLLAADGAAAESAPLRRLLSALACVPWLLALCIAASRVHDDWHFPSDVVAGSALGAWVASFAFHLYFPAVPPAPARPLFEQEAGANAPHCCV
ncbi:hypothetical protein AB1Y20_002211 [Prymnesium parvum]|uniref:Phosphatidic acid phosphatase type 2/haloperoxidase domain-containing protein n=1 Tax=Prymnesium parvum TaxID=97485 RepID=A0AB34J8Q7_PRYPA